MRFETSICGRPNPTKPTKVDTSPSTNIRLMASMRDVPNVPSAPKKKANTADPIAVGTLIDDDDISSTNCDISCPPSAVYATTIAVRRNQNSTPVTISPGTPRALRDMERKDDPPLPPSDDDASTDAN
mmetsp:Transcript_22318/g.52898  ORF Transcript_22318/g.52898 Transcript_22318/m.52898 type:complete len:128 (-) Transcript_22318:6-389(-)